jgi:hypothetical protein
MSSIPGGETFNLCPFYYFSHLRLNKLVKIVFITINAPVFFMEREVMDFWREICITRASYRGGP